MTEDAPETPHEPPRGRRGLVVGAVALVLAVVAAVAVYATAALSGGGRQPEELVPATAFAFAKVDLDPAAGQKLAARRLFGRLPGLAGDGADGLFDDLLGQVFGNGRLSYARDVEPWFDRRAGVAAFPGDGGTEVVAVLRSKDDGKARAALDKARVPYAITKGYAVVAERRPAVDAAVRLAAGRSLRDGGTYRADTAALRDTVAVGWADLEPAFAAFGGALPFGVLPRVAVGGLARGRLVAGLHLTGDYAEVSAVTVGAPPRTPGKPADLVPMQRLPVTTVAAVSVAGLGETLRSGAHTLADLGVDPDRALRGLLGGTGLAVIGDLVPLLGDTTLVVAGSAFGALDTTRLALVARVEDPAEAKRTGPLLAAAATAFGVPATSAVDEGVFYAGTASWVAELRKGGDLGQTSAFRKAMGDLSDAAGAAYAHLPGTGLLDSRLRGVRTLGAVWGTRGGQGYFRLRLVAG